MDVEIIEIYPYKHYSKNKKSGIQTCCTLEKNVLIINGSLSIPMNKLEQIKKNSEEIHIKFKSYNNTKNL